MDLGTDRSSIYDAPSSPAQDKKSYPSVTLPLDLIKGMNLEVGDEVALDLKGKITSITQDEYSKDFRVELSDGEAESTKEAAAEEK